MKHTFVFYNYVTLYSFQFDPVVCSIIFIYIIYKYNIVVVNHIIIVINHGLQMSPEIQLYFYKIFFLDKVNNIHIHENMLQRKY